MKHPPLDWKVRKQLDSFLEGMQRSELNDAWIEHIESLLKSNEAAQRYYLDKITMIGFLEVSLKSEATAKAYQKNRPKIVSVTPSRANVTTRFVALAALLLMALGVVYLLPRAENEIMQQTITKVVEVMDPLPVLVEEEREYAYLSQDIGSIWESREKPIRFTKGEYVLERGRVQLILNDGAHVAIQAPARFRIDSNTPEWQDGVFVFEKSAIPDLSNVVIGHVEVQTLRGKLGFKIQDGKYSCTQLGGESFLVIPRDYAGVTSEKKLNRGQGIRWHEGMYIDGIVGSTSPYIDLERSFKKGVELLANAHFEFPRMERNGFVSPSGWDVKLFPSMMAKVNHTNVAGLKISKQRVANNQWGSLLCERLPDGTMYGSSFEQLVSKNKQWQGKTLQFHGKFKLDKSFPIKEPLTFRCGFYSGLSQSELPLEVKDYVIQPEDHEVKSFDISYNSFVKPVYKKELFMRVEVMVLSDYGKQGLLLDDLSLTILKD